MTPTVKTSNPHIFSVKAKIIVVFVIVTIGQKGLQFVYMIICNKNIISRKPINNLLILFFLYLQSLWLT